MARSRFFKGCLFLFVIFIAIALVLGAYLVSKYNNMVSLEEGVTSQWAQVENVYQRRYDLIPNLVETVKGYAEHEKDTLTAVVEARSKVSQSLKIDKEALSDPQAFSQFQKAQGHLSSVLSKLMVVVEKYPDLKANENFLALQSQLEGTENRIAVERKRYNDKARAFNTYIKKIPNNLLSALFHFKSKEYFQADTGAKKAPKIKFTK